MLLGLGNGATDVAMNALGVAVEKARPMPVMSRFHAFWSIGSFGGAAVVFLSAWLVGDENGSVILPAMLAIVVLAAVGLVVTLRWIPETEPVSHTVDGRKEPIPRVAWLLGAMAVCFGLMEGTAYDWSGVHMADVAGVDAGTASIAVVTVTLFMVAMRLAGDWAVARFGHRPVVWFGAVAAAIGYAITVFATAVPVLLVGWAFVGFGVAMIAPQVYATSGYLGGGRMLAVVVTFGYAAFLSGPAVLGWLVHTFGVQKAMLLPFALSFVLVVITRWMPAIERGRPRPSASERAPPGRLAERDGQGQDHGGGDGQPGRSEPVDELGQPSLDGRGRVDDRVVRVASAGHPDLVRPVPGDVGAGEDQEHAAQPVHPRQDPAQPPDDRVLGEGHGQREDGDEQAHADRIRDDDGEPGGEAVRAARRRQDGEERADGAGEGGQCVGGAVGRHRPPAAGGDAVPVRDGRGRRRDRSAGPRRGRPVRCR